MGPAHDPIIFSARKYVCVGKGDSIESKIFNDSALMSSICILFSRARSQRPR